MTITTATFEGVEYGPFDDPERLGGVLDCNVFADCECPRCRTEWIEHRDEPMMPQCPRCGNRAVIASLGKSPAGLEPGPTPADARHYVEQHDEPSSFYTHPDDFGREL